MTISYELGSNPFWYFADNNGKPLGSGFMVTKDSLNPTQDKPVYQDPAGNFPWPNPIDFNANGTQGPFYFKIDTDNPDSLYFLSIYDTNGNLVDQIDDYQPPSGGGGGNVTTNINLKNYIVNNNFLYNSGNLSNPDSEVVICPSSHMNFIAPDIIFLRSGSGSAIDSLSFNQFIWGSNPLTDDFVPLNYVTYTSTSTTGETLKCIQIPINPDVNTLSNQPMTFTLWAQGVSGNISMQIALIQYYGTGGSPSSTDVTIIDTITFTNNWAPYKLNFTVPDISGKVPSSTNDDGTYLQLRFPINTNTNINFAKPCLYVGTLSPDSDFDSIAQIESIIETPRTADVKSSSFSTNYIPMGWLAMTDGSIGNSSSNATARANLDTWFLFYYLWNSSNSLIVFDDAGNPVARGGTAQSDWDNNYSISLPLSEGRVIANFSGGHPFTSSVGSDTHVLTINEMPAHSHSPSNSDGSAQFIVNSPPLVGGGSGGLFASQRNTANTGGNAAHNIIQPTTYLTYMIKL